MIHALRTGLIGLGLSTLLACGGAPAPAPGTTDPRAAYDAAVLAALDGDAMAWRQGMVRVAADHPNTPYGRAALAQLGSSSGAAIMVLGLVAAVAIPAFTGYMDGTTVQNESDEAPTAAR